MIPNSEQGDAGAAQSDDNILPVVAKPPRGLSGAAILVIAAVMGIMLFSVLEARRQAEQAPAIMANGGDQLAAVSPPPLMIPPPISAPIRLQFEQPLPSTSRTLPPPPIPAPTPTPNTLPIVQSQPPQYQESVEAPAPPKRNSSGPALVLDHGPPSADENQGIASNIAARSGSSASTNRARASILANRSTTVAQGTLLRAVLETALNSTSPGFARAIVSRDIYSFDGTRVLIPRGSRLIGEYDADTRQGQNRALINWTRLLRPDGATIAIGSPSADTLGRGGIKAQVNSHFLERFGSAILQSVLDIGVNAAAHSTNGTVILSLPGSQVSNVGQALQSQQIAPTLKVNAGTSISIFVARDLDFSDVEERE
jgi:type IV secretion system protein VirB10